MAVTGATGLLGNSLVDFYIQSGWEVYVPIKDEHSSLKLNNRINKVYGNVNNKSDVDFLIPKSRPNFFIHLAAQTQAYDSLKYPYNTFFTNCVGTLNVLESRREYAAAKAIVVASSAKAYGELQDNEYVETSSLNGIYPYDASKSITDIICRSYKRTYSMPIATTRACNIYGKRDYNQQRLIPAIVGALRTGKHLVMRNGREDTREYIHVDDVVSAYCHILEYIQNSGIEDSFNISSGERFATKEIVQMIQTHVGKEIPIRNSPDRTMEIKKQFMNSDLLREATGWKPKMRFESSLGEIVNWYLRQETMNF